MHFKIKIIKRIKIIKIIKIMKNHSHRNRHLILYTKRGLKYLNKNLHEIYDTVVTYEKLTQLIPIMCFGTLN